MTGSPLRILVEDGTGAVELVFFRDKYIDKMLRTGCGYVFYGTPDFNYGRLQVVHPEFSLPKDAVTTILPVYRLTKGLSQKDIRKAIIGALEYTDCVQMSQLQAPTITTKRNDANEINEQIDADNVSPIIEHIPAEILKKHRLCPLEYAISAIHFPQDEKQYNVAKRRLIYDEFFLLALGLRYLRSADYETKEGIRFHPDYTIEEYKKSMPFTLTEAQDKVIRVIYSDMESSGVMHRLVAGDVGSGKTAVAFAALIKAVNSGYQAAMMAPTEILAKQHYLEMQKLFPNVPAVFLSSSLKVAEKREVLDALKTGAARIAIGTHSLISEAVEYENLGLVVTDEQHRFGVNQRKTLSAKAKSAATASTNADGSVTDFDTSPDVLVMSATPIPRSLAWVLYGDLDISMLDVMPEGRLAIITRAIESKNRASAYAFMQEELNQGHQGYIVAPIIDDQPVYERDERGGDDAVNHQIPSNYNHDRQQQSSQHVHHLRPQNQTNQQLRSLKSIFADASRYFKNHRVAMLHGAMPQEEKDEIMARFAAGEIDVLCSTVVIEVGVNVKNATVMIIEHAERFGLAQLHQLRGRVGRSNIQSYCMLILDKITEKSKERAKTLVSTNDGFVIAEKDLELRGSGDPFGTRQHGLMEMKIADLADSRHKKLLQLASEDAKQLIQADPNLQEVANTQLLEIIQSKFSPTEIGL
jgi:ATP-dependent DNA helicase RecG